MTEEPKKQFEIHVNLDGLTLGDMETLDDPKIKVTVLLDILQRAIVGVDIRAMPLTMLTALRRAIVDKVAELANSKN